MERGARLTQAVRDGSFAVTASPGTWWTLNWSLERINSMKERCNLGVKSIQLCLLLLFNQGWCVASNVVSHRSQVDGVLAVQSMGANTADMNGIRAARALAIVLLESTAMAAGRYLLRIKLRMC